MTTLPFKVFTHENHYIAATRHPEEAAMLMRHRGYEIRTGHRRVDAVWREGFEKQPASESYDLVAETVRERMDKIRAVALARLR